MGSIELSLAVESGLGPDVVFLAIGVERSRMTVDAPTGRRDQPAIVGAGPLEHGFAQALRLGQWGPESTMAIGGTGNRGDVELQSLELFGSERLDTREEHRESGATLALQGRIQSGPFERRRVEDPAQGPVVHRVYTDPVRLDVVGDAVDVAIGMAGVARELAPEGDIGTVKELLAPPGLGDHLGATEIDLPHRFEALQVDDRHRVIEGVGHIGGLVIGGDGDSPRALSGPHECLDELRGDGQMVGKDSLALLGRGRLQDGPELADIDDGQPIGAAAGYQGQTAIRCHGDIGGIRESEIRLVQQDLIGATVTPHDPHAVGDGPSLQQAGHRHQVLRAVQGNHGELATRVPGHALEEIGGRKNDPVFDRAALSIDHGDL